MMTSTPVVQGATTAIPEDVGLSTERLRGLQAWQENMVAEERLPCTHVMVLRHGKVAYNVATGYESIEKLEPIKQNTIHRMYSMTKCIASAALMMLVEEGKLQISDPAYLYLGPSWKKQNMSVYVPDSYRSEDKSFDTVPCEKNITVRMLLTHTSGLSYGFDATGVLNKVDKIYATKLRERRNADDVFGNLASFCSFLSSMPLVFQPGTAWNYGFNTDVIGRLVEVISGKSLEIFLQERVFRPLGMLDTSFVVPPEKRNRFADVYMRKGQVPGMLSLGKGPKEDRGLTNITGQFDERYLGELSDPTFFMSGGGGLAGTVSDYSSFAACMLNGGELNGTRILSRKSVQFMTMNQLGLDEVSGQERDMGKMSPPIPMYSEAASLGMGFGLGFSVVLRPGLSPFMCSKGAFAWGGAASTAFWCDPEEDLICIFASQLRFRDDFKMPINATLRNLVYACVIDGNAAGGCSRL